MTARSERRRAELEVINAAVSYVNGTHDHESWVKLEDAVAWLQYLGLDKTATAQPGRRDTSAAAAASLPNIGPEAKRCYDEIDLGGGLTVDQLEQILGRPHQSVSARVNDLVNRGWIVDSGQRRKTRSGRKAIIWIPSELARKENP